MTLVYEWIPGKFTMLYTLYTIWLITKPPNVVLHIHILSLHTRVYSKKKKEREIQLIWFSGALLYVLYINQNQPTNHIHLKPLIKGQIYIISTFFLELDFILRWFQKPKKRSGIYQWFQPKKNHATTNHHILLYVCFQRTMFRLFGLPFFYQHLFLFW